jgi:hypothetical protein
MNYLYDTSYGKIHIDLSSNNIIVRASGGFDSSVLLYAIANAASELDKGKDFTIYPITVVKIGNEKDVYDLDKHCPLDNLENILNFIRKSFPNITVNDVIPMSITEWWKQKVFLNAQDTLRSSVVTSLKIQKDYLEYNGITKNPDIVIGHEGFNPEVHRQKILEEFAISNTISAKRGNEVLPFRNFDKRAVFSLADRLNILEEMLTITRSCEGRSIDTDNFTKVCGVCWWCCEREWAKLNYER